MRRALWFLLVWAWCGSWAYAGPEQDAQHALDTREFERALSIARRSSTKAWAQNIEGVCLLDGLGVSKDKARGAALLEKSAGFGFVPARLNLAGWHRSAGRHDQALKIYRDLALRGEPLGRHFVAAMTLRGEGVAVDENAARKELQQLAREGVWQSRLLLGQDMLERGQQTSGRKRIISVYRQLHPEWRKKYPFAGAPVISDTELEMGKCYLHGHGTRKDNVAARVWLRVAAGKGDNVRAMVLLAGMEERLHESGTKSEKRRFSPKRAALRCALAAVVGDESAYETLKRNSKRDAWARELRRVNVLRRFGEKPNPTAADVAVLHTLLRDAITSGSLDTVRRILNAAPAVPLAASIVDRKSTALSFAASFGRPRIVWLLVHKGANLDGVGPDGKTALFAAIGNSNQEPAARRLLEMGANPNATTRLGSTPLISAAYSGPLSAVRLLVEHKARIDVAGNDGWTALHGAARRGSMEIVRYLLANGAKPDARTDKGKLPSDLAAVREHPAVAALLRESRTAVAQPALSAKHGRAKSLFEAREFERAFLIASRSLDRPWAQHLTGVCLLHGLAVPKDEPRGIKVMQMAAAAGFAKAKLELGDWHRRAGRHEDALKSYREAAAAREPLGRHAVAVMTLHGEGVGKDEAAARRELEELARDGVWQSRFLLGKMLIDRADHKYGFRQLREAYKGIHPKWWSDRPAAAPRAVPDVEFEIGKCYAHGLGVEPSGWRARLWLARAAWKGDHAGAMSLLAGLDERGGGNKPNASKAARWYAFAAFAGDEAGFEALEAHRNSDDPVWPYELGRVLIFRQLGATGQAALAARSRAYKLFGETNAFQDHIAEENPSRVNLAVSQSLLRDALRVGSLDMVRRILNAPDTVAALVNSTLAGRTPLSLAASLSRAEFVWLLLNKGAQVDGLSANGWTPLHFAASSGHRESVDLLLQNGASNKARTDGGERPGDIARQNKHAGLVTLLGASRVPAPAELRVGLSDARNAFNANEYERALFIACQSPDKPWAQNIVGLCYYAGLGVPKDEQRGIRLYEKAAAAGFARARANLAGWHRSAKRYDQALELYRAVAAGGDAIEKEDVGRARHFIAHMTLLGQGVPKNESAAKQALAKLAAEGVTASRILLGQILLGARRDNAGAEWIRKANSGLHTSLGEPTLWVSARAAHPEFLMGLCYLHGRGVDKSASQAERWFGKAARWEHTAAQVQLAGLLEKDGLGEPDTVRAARLCAFAALAGDEDAQKFIEDRKAASFVWSYQLGRLLVFRSAGSDGDWTKTAQALFSSAAELKVKNAVQFQKLLRDGDREGAEIAVYQSWLWEAIVHGQLGAVRKVLARTGNPKTWANAELGSGLTPLIAAAHYNRTRIAWLLIHEGARIDARDGGKNGVTPLIAALLPENVEVTTLLLSMGADPNYPDGKGVMPLMWAAGGGNTEQIAALLAHKADSTARDSGGAHAWHYAAKRSVEALKALGTGLLNAGDETGRRPLHIAAQAGRLSVVRYIVDDVGRSGVDPADNRGWTPLHTAAARGHMDVVRFLISNGANAGTTTKKNSRPDHIAAHNEHKDVAEFLAAKHNSALPLLARIQKRELDLIDLRAVVKDYPAAVHYKLVEGAVVGDETDEELGIHRVSKNAKLLRYLLDKGAHPPAWCVIHCLEEGKSSSARHLVRASTVGALNIGHNGVPAVYAAAAKGDMYTLELLLKKGVSVNGRRGNKLRQTALIIAAAKNYDKMVELLLRYRPDPDIQDTKGFTALHFAAEKGHTRIVELLIKRGAKLHLLTEDDATPLHYAARFDRVGAVSVLCKAGAKVNLKDNKGRSPLALTRNRDAIGILTLHGAKR